VKHFVGLTAHTTILNQIAKNWHAAKNSAGPAATFYQATAPDRPITTYGALTRPPDYFL